MSVTGHNPVRRADDYYATPSWCTLSILRHLPDFKLALDPCAGDGAILRVLRETYSARVLVEGIELDQERARVAGARHGDALAPSTAWPRADLVITNPPYKLAMEFVERALAEVTPGGTVAMLLRLGWLASQKRAAFLRRNTPCVYVLSRRPSFTGSGTDSADYAWMLWGPHEAAMLAILGP